jgi:hypothetical protein
MLISKSLSARKDAVVLFKPEPVELRDGSWAALRFFLEIVTVMFLASFFCPKPDLPQ